MGLKIQVLACIIVLLAVISVTDSGRGGGGSRGSSSRGSSSRSGSRGYRSRSSSSGSRSYRSSNLRGWTVRRKVTALRGGLIVYNHRLYRFNEHKDLEDDFFSVSLCRNVETYPQFNSSVETYGWFLCPMDSDPLKNKYCCGEEDLGHCCESRPLSTGAIFGITIGVLIFLVSLVVCVIRRCGFASRRRNISFPGDAPRRRRSVPPRVAFKPPTEVVQRYRQPDRVSSASRHSLQDELPPPYSETDDNSCANNKGSGYVPVRSHCPPARSHSPPKVPSAPENDNSPSQRHSPQWSYSPPPKVPSAPESGYSPPPKEYSPPEKSYSPPPKAPSPPEKCYSPPTLSDSPPRNHSPPSNSYSPSARSYSPPARSHSPPARSHSPPARSHSPPARSHSPPARSHSPPARSHSPPSRSHSPPARSYSPASCGSGGGGGYDD